MDHYSHRHCTHSETVFRLIISLILNFIIFLVELSAGIFSHSLALISDSIHNLSDFSAILITLAANKLSLKKATYTKSFGFKRAETIGALINIVILLVMAILLFMKGIQRLKHPVPVLGSVMIFVSIIGLIANLLAAFILRKSACWDLGIKSVIIHLLADALSSVGVIITGLLVHFTHNYILDPILSISIASFIIWNCWGIFKETINILLEGVPNNIDLRQIKNRLKQIEEILDVHHIHVWGISSRHINASCHILLKDCPLTEVEKVIHEAGKVLYEEFHINHVTIQPETLKYEKITILCQSC